MTHPALFHEPDHVYHSTTGHMSSHRLSRIRKGEPIEVRTDNPAFKFGRWAHRLILEGEVEFWGTCVVGGIINPSTGKTFGLETKKHQTLAGVFADSVEFELVTPEAYRMICQMRDAVHRHKYAAGLLERGEAELVGRDVLCGVRSQIRCDWLTPCGKLVDLKTCRSLDRFTVDAVAYDYMHQIAFYQDVLKVITGEHHEAYIIAVDKQERPQAEVFHICGDLLEQARTENHETLRVVAETNDTYSARIN